ncbi:hypothetical protein [Nocardioides sp. R-C-SC26]|uniref:hypothetical protein n=1 Tax=Nocardioides sp. R-C-SC26 TaxID=2870414 RepID=UPI001E2B7D99|nr:hypothetical protein [Nocardioides sp. R-C-SC26]
MSALLDIADELYAVPITEFTADRDARARAAKATDNELAAAVKSLRKPSTAAWVINLLTRRDPDGVRELLAVGEALRAAQSAMSAEELRALTRQRRQLTAAITQQARSLAREEGVRTTEAVADQVEGTLTAAMLSRGCAEAVRSGLLVSTFATTGLDEVDVRAHVALAEALGHAATPRDPVGHEPPPRPELHLVPDPDADAKARAAAEEDLVEARRALTDAESERDQVRVTVEDLKARQLQVESEIDELRRRIADLESVYDDVDDDLGDAEAALAEAEEVLAEAREVADAAQAAVTRL